MRIYVEGLTGKEVEIASFDSDAAGIAHRRRQNDLPAVERR
ncbi:MAG: hypothetical protein WKF71_01910 [Pyrinomonadaceae bacterium]